MVYIILANTRKKLDAKFDVMDIFILYLFLNLSAVRS